MITKFKYDQIYEIVNIIPTGMVATYGQIAKIVGCPNPRMVGYAMYSIPFNKKVAWHRVINSKGEISIRKDGEPSTEQKKLLEEENIIFTKSGKIPLKKYQWSGPSWDWYIKNNMEPPIKMV